MQGCFFVICASCRTQGNYFIGHSERQPRFIFAGLQLFFSLFASSFSDARFFLFIQISFK
jgi:hypothetical protein